MLWRFQFRTMAEYRLFRPFSGLAALLDSMPGTITGTIAGVKAEHLLPELRLRRKPIRCGIF